MSRSGEGHAVVRVLKSLIAASLAWGATVHWLPGQGQYLAVAGALLMVNTSTVYRSANQALHSAVTRIAGTALPLLGVWLLGSAVGTVAVILAITLVTAGRRVSDDRLQIASTAVLTLAAATVVPAGHAILAALGTVVGAAAGMTVNALVLPPLHLAESDTAIRDLAGSMGTLLRQMGGGLWERRHVDRADAWLEQARDLERLVGEAQQHVEEGQESVRWNTRCALGRCGSVSHSELWHALHGVSFQIRGIARTLADHADAGGFRRLGPIFVERYAELLELAGDAVEAFVAPPGSKPADQDEARERLPGALDRAQSWHDTMTDLVGHGTLAHPDAWHVYGALMTDLERLLIDLQRTDTHAAPAR
ncbi:MULTISPECIES: FUSC family protein [unclassified Streptomyces]|uniref:FUSC family protein n=1 Tax=unclassified Streptomyces TaxID=2593676 RepID=UPI002DD8F5AD|nr:hypothetical protein [Streptomyces sp. NBC_01761]WSC50995.1 hypothetical protein OG808_00620 [Streptomyces sp. NBC_01761]WSC58526.1 hypothetical protein OG808_43695 [Streptomyces sp. NBC_01761]WSF81831.1 hypothetical protein OIE70_00635 [Streptomyces sp. NBC_01744]WSF89634.1 hypothetical protein OIE70_45295 [Streptomyces sp. NBC_01744]